MNLIKAMERFHVHLDECKQCRDNPFGLCKVGEPLLLATAESEAVEGIRKILGDPK